MYSINLTLLFMQQTYQGLNRVHLLAALTLTNDFTLLYGSCINELWLSWSQDVLRTAAGY